MTWTKEQRAMAAAHLCDLAGVAFREGRYLSGKIILEEAAGVTYDNTPDACYRLGLLAAEFDPMPVAAAVASILRGEHPADSLPGCVAKMRAVAVRPADCPPGSEGWCIEQGSFDALDGVLEMLGVKVPR